MNAHIITIGDEILVGQTVDTNSTHIAKELNSIGIAVSEMQSIKDEALHIINSLKSALLTNELVIITGGLGPTNDDITKNVLTNFFNDELIMYPKVLAKVQDFFIRFNKPFLEVNKLQAMLPKNADIIINDLGTASGMWFTQGGKIVISLPGVPYEMKGLMKKVISNLRSDFNLGSLFHKTILLQGIGESYLANDLEEWESEIRAKGITVSYLPSIGTVKIRLTGNVDDKTYILDQLNRIEKQYPKEFFGYNDDRLECVIGELLKAKQKTLGTVESCTAGALSSRITSVPGSSAYFKGAIVSYANEIKTNLVEVDSQNIEQFGAVSKAVVEQMAMNGLKKLNVDYCVATSGIAGPDGGTKEKPVGTIWICVATNDAVYSKMFNFGHSRVNNIESTVVYAMNYLRRMMLNLLE
jgi:nicotinamide-nucleotide amidase